MQGFTEFPIDSIKCAESVYGLAVNISGSFFVLGHCFSEDNLDKTNLSMWNLEKKEKEKTLLYEADIKYPNKIEIVKSDEKVVFLCENGFINIINLSSIEYDKYPYKNVTDISPGNNNLIAVSSLNSGLFDVNTMKEVYRISEVSVDKNILIKLSCDGTKIYAANLKKEKIVVLNVHDMTEINTLDEAPLEIIDAHLDCHELYYYCRSEKDGGESVWSIPKNKKIFEKIFKLSSGPSSPFVDFHPSLPIIASGSNHGLVMLLNLEEENILSMQSVSDFPVSGLSFVPNGEQLLIATGDGFVHFLDISSLKKHD